MSSWLLKANPTTPTPLCGPPNALPLPLPPLLPLLPLMRLPLSPPTRPSLASAPGADSAAEPPPTTTSEGGCLELPAAAATEPPVAPAVSMRPGPAAMTAPAVLPRSDELISGTGLIALSQVTDADGCVPLDVLVLEALASVPTPDATPDSTLCTPCCQSAPRASSFCTCCSQSCCCLRCCCCHAFWARCRSRCCRCCCCELRMASRTLSGMLCGSCRSAPWLCRLLPRTFRAPSFPSFSNRMLHSCSRLPVLCRRVDAFLAPAQAAPAPAPARAPAEAEAEAGAAPDAKAEAAPDDARWSSMTPLAETACAADRELPRAVGDATLALPAAGLALAAWNGCC